ncbi:MAG: cysteine desulfurase family protein [Anaerolineae bacterium]
MSNTIIYLDNSAATRLDERVFEAMKPYFFDTYAVATSQFGYSLGVDAKDALDGARASIARRLGAATEEIVFTSGATESSNMAIKGAAHALAKKGRHLITSKIEDFPVLNSMRALEREGYEVTYLATDANGTVDLDALRHAFTPGTVLVSIQMANQEIGTLQNLANIATISKEYGAILHTDATHTFPRLPLDVAQIPVDLITITGEMIHGPKGSGALYIRQGTPLHKWMDGGFQEYNLRAGVENIPGAIGFAKAVELVTPEETARLQAMRDRVIALLAAIPDSRLNGHAQHRLPQNANVSFRFVEGEAITLHLDMRGFAVSTGSACFSRSLEASHVILGIGGNHEQAHGSVRITFGRYNTLEDADRVAEALTVVISRLRAISPLGKD